MLANVTSTGISYRQTTTAAALLGLGIMLPVFAVGIRIHSVLFLRIPGLFVKFRVPGTEIRLFDDELPRLVVCGHELGSLGCLWGLIQPGERLVNHGLQTCRQLAGITNVAGNRCFPSTGLLGLPRLRLRCLLVNIRWYTLPGYWLGLWQGQLHVDRETTWR